MLYLVGRIGNKYIYSTFLEGKSPEEFIFKH